MKNDINAIIDNFNIDRSTLWRWQNGKTKPDLEKLEEISSSGIDVTPFAAPMITKLCNICNIKPPDFLNMQHCTKSTQPHTNTKG